MKLTHCTNTDGKYMGAASDDLIYRNSWTAIPDGHGVYIDEDQSIIITDAPPEKALAIESRPDSGHINQHGKWGIQAIEKPAAPTSTPADVAFMRLIGSYTIKATYPEKQNAMDKAVASLNDDANADELFAAASQILNA